MPFFPIIGLAVGALLRNTAGAITTVLGLLWLRTRLSAIAAGCVLLGVLSLAPWLLNMLAVATNGQRFWTPRPDLGSIADTLSY